MRVRMCVCYFFLPPFVWLQDPQGKRRLQDTHRHTHHGFGKRFLECLDNISFRPFCVHFAGKQLIFVREMSIRAGIGGGWSKRAAGLLTPLGHVFVYPVLPYPCGKGEAAVVQSSIRGETSFDLSDGCVRCYNVQTALAKHSYVALNVEQHYKPRAVPDSNA